MDLSESALSGMVIFFFIAVRFLKEFRDFLFPKPREWLESNYAEGTNLGEHIENLARIAFADRSYFVDSRKKYNHD